MMQIRHFSCAAAGLALSLTATGLAHADDGVIHTFTWTQGFESGTEGLTTFRGGSIIQAPSGLGGVTSRYGSGHAVGTLISDYPGGSIGSGFRRTGGLYDDFFPFDFHAESFTERVSFFIDHTAGSVGDRWFSTMTDATQRGFWFQRAAGGWQVATNFASGGIEAIYAGAVDIGAGGWLTFERTVTRNGLGLADMRYAIYDIDNALLYEREQSDVAGTPLTPGTWAVGWRAGGDIEVIADEVSFEVSGIVIPTPGTASLALLGFGVVAFRRRR